jgi:pimeloyl-ACP methyl ester carboxylesterase
VGIVSRFTDQKGFDLLAEVADALLQEDLALVALGTGSPEYEELFRALAARAPDRVSALVLLAPVSIGRVPIVPLARAISPRWLESMAPRLTFRWTIATGLWLSRAGKTALSAREVDEYWAPTQFPEMTMAAVRMLHAFDWEPDTSAITTRTLVILAGGDRLVHAEPESTYHVVRGAGHNVQEQAPDEVNRLVLSFLTA